MALPGPWNLLLEFIRVYGLALSFLVLPTSLHGGSRATCGSHGSYMAAILRL